MKFFQFVFLFFLLFYQTQSVVFIPTVDIEQGQPLTLSCTAEAGSNSLTWVQTNDRRGAFLVSEDSRVRLSNDGTELIFDFVVIDDEEKYFCGLYDEQAGTFQTLKQFTVFVKGIYQRFFWAFF